MSIVTLQIICRSLSAGLEDKDTGVTDALNIRPMTHPPTTDHQSTSDHTVSTVCKLLANPTRRAAVQLFIDEETDTAAFDTLVEYVHEEVDAITSPEQARIALVHNHLPRLADYDIIEYDRHGETVHYHETPHLERYLILTEEIEARD